MSSIRQKFKKNKSQSKQQQQTLQSFDQTSLEINVTPCNTQLQPIILSCQWNNPTLTMVEPKLDCKWFNKTQSNIEEIVGITSNSYQPCLCDVGQMIHIQVMPTLSNVPYQGMPIIRQIGPIKLDPQTEEQAQDLLKAGKVTFLVEIKNKNGTVNANQQNQGLLKIIDNELRIYQRINNEQILILHSQINENYPHLSLNRCQSSELQIINSQNKELTITLGNHRMRDVICLVIRLIINCNNNNNTTINNNIISQEGSIVSNDDKFSTYNMMLLSEQNKQIKTLQAENIKLQKEEINYKNNIQQIQLKMNMINERMQNLNRNYFQLQQQLNIKQKIRQKNQEQLSYNKNQVRLLRQINQKLLLNIEQKQKKIQLLQLQFKQFNKQQQNIMCYKQLYQQYKKYLIFYQEIKLKYQFVCSQRNQLEENLKRYQSQIEIIECEKNHLEKKYSSLSYQLNSPTKTKFSKEPSIDSCPKMSSQISSNGQNQKHYYNENEIKQLKSNVASLIRENNTLKGQLLKGKDKSKAQLKLDLIQIKKLANSLAETITEKDLELEHIKIINKKLSQRIFQLNQISMQSLNNKNSMQ